MSKCQVGAVTTIECVTDKTGSIAHLEDYRRTLRQDAFPGPYAKVVV